jgi:hypothetical protein
MALIDKVPGELKLYIGGYVIMQTTVSMSPTTPAWGTEACESNESDAACSR